MAQLRSEAERQSMSVDELIRQTMEELLQRERAKVLDPFANIDSIGDPGESDLASCVDEIYDK